VPRYWTRFALNGDQNGDDDLEWPEYEDDDHAYMALRDPPEVGTGLSDEDCEFWRDYFLQGATIVLY
jgi:carboxylesterase type B